MAKKVRVIQKAPKTGKLSRLQVKKAVKAVKAEKAETTPIVAAKQFKKEVNAALKKYLAAIA